jgi:AcrR family transcriptional regulator
MNIHSCHILARLTLDYMQLRLDHPPAATAAPKSAEILRAVKAAFVEKGFDGASMQDLARAAGMSVGNFYRYFPSKDAIVAQMIALDMAEIEAEFARVLSSPSPMATLRALIAHRVNDASDPQEGPLWAEIAAAALRKPDIAASACAMENTVSGYLAQVFAAETGLPLAEATDDGSGSPSRRMCSSRTPCNLAPSSNSTSYRRSPLRLSVQRNTRPKACLALPQSGYTTRRRSKSTDKQRQYCTSVSSSPALAPPIEL